MLGHICSMAGALRACMTPRRALSRHCAVQRSKKDKKHAVHDGAQKRSAGAAAPLASAAPPAKLAKAGGNVLSDLFHEDGSHNSSKETFCCRGMSSRAA